MKKIKVIYQSAATLIMGGAMLLAAGCDVERLPYNEIPADALDAGNIETVTRGSYGKLKEEAFYKIIHQVGEYGGDNISLSGTTSDQLFNIYTYHRSATNSYSAQFWQYSYTMMANINSMIELIPEGESAAKDQLLGENYFLRGYNYFQLCNVYARPYADGNGNTPGVPLKLTSDIADFPPRASVKEVYDQIVKDLTKAAGLMTEKKQNIYASKETAQAFLSRVYLYMGEWEKAKEMADAVINSGRYTLLTGTSYKNYPRSVPEENTETIFAIRMVKDTDYEKYHMNYYSVGALYSKINNVGWGEMYPSETYMKLIDENPGDLRHGFIVPETPDVPYTWLVYTNEVPMYVVAMVTRQADGSYKIADEATVEANEDAKVVSKNDSYFTSNVVEQSGGKYYVTEAATNKRYEVKIEAAAKTRNGYPKRFIYKCSFQEEQAQLYSPVMMRFAEMYLNRAEAKWHLGQYASAVDDINVLRTRTEIPKRVADGADDSTVFTWIMNERRLELAWEGQRKYDIYRNNLTLDRFYPGSHRDSTPVEDGLTLSSPLIVELIPQAELDAYPGELTQNQ
ncbi:MAG: RagB/SusD family nutrient uptake outer membrane protein [Mediterranea sp.]|jgi:hypothetical protein|nr:RagB/SusD family nutrient uptake outer membrane protein [Mediterranea sp.]